MPKADPFTKALKKIQSLRDKSEKITAELSELNDLILALQSEASASTPVESPTPKGRKAKADATDEEPKRRGRPKAAEKVEPSEPKKRGRKPKSV